jgi:hypothetical protein
MNGSHRPIVQMFRRLCVRAEFYDPYLQEYDFDKVLLPDTDQRSYELQLKAMRRFGRLDVPANLPLRVIRTRFSERLVCNGFCLSTL